MTIRITGKRFSHVHFTRGEPLKDGKKARFRAAKLTDEHFRFGNSKTVDYRKSAIKQLEIELGMTFGTRSTNGKLIQSFEWFFNRITILEFLDALTVLVIARNARYRAEGNTYLAELKRIFLEENLAYEFDDEGGVHPLVDGAFTANTNSAIAALEGERYAGTLALIDSIDGHLIQNPSSYVGAIRAVFGANENLFKLMFGTNQLNAKFAAQHIGPIQQRLYDGHPLKLGSNSKMLAAFKQWIDAAHFYRHEEGAETPTQPNEEFSVLFVSQGLGFVRWLAQIDRLETAAKASR
ncbi:hypothetical protein [Halocynthiibacter namhaensis]|uniref:hypothetical protein n=1 Tax=Halocynthiibacter namhaensis TaxID=1290553 RepID=UPI00057929F0|nr:hypothetical protein [Halocynthiibacter namhaensis]